MGDFLRAVMKSERQSAVIEAGSRGRRCRDASGPAPQFISPFYLQTALGPFCLRFHGVTCFILCLTPFCLSVQTSYPRMCSKMELKDEK